GGRGGGSRGHRLLVLRRCSPGGEGVAGGVLHVHHVERAGVALAVADDADTANIAAARHHAEVALKEDDLHLRPPNGYFVKQSNNSTNHTVANQRTTRRKRTRGLYEPRLLSGLITRIGILNPRRY